MTSRTLAGVAAAVIAVIVSCAGLGGVATGGLGAGGCAPPDGNPSSPEPAATVSPPPAGHPRIGRWNPTQVGNAATIIAVGAQRRVPVRGWLIAVATAMQESSLRNLPGGDRDSLGLFQQRPSQGWGTPAQLLDPVYAASRFYATLLTVPGWQAMPLTEAAQKVQNSGAPDAYAQWEDDARTVVETLTDASGLSGCNVAVGPQGWVAPVRAPVTSGYRTPARPDHQGVDLGAERGTEIHAAAAGTVTVATCNVRPASHGCDQDGNPKIEGCGWYVQLDHTSTISTVYCHMLHRPTVAVRQPMAAGQVIGLVGSSGNSSAEHLHYEVLINGAPTNPVPWMRPSGPAGITERWYCIGCNVRDHERHVLMPMSQRGRLDPDPARALALPRMPAGRVCEGSSSLTAMRAGHRPRPGPAAVGRRP